MLSCRDLTNLSVELLEGDLPLGRRLAVRFHLGICSHCRRFVEQMKRLLGALPSIDGAAPASDVEAAAVAVLQAVHSHGQQPGPPS